MPLECLFSSLCICSRLSILCLTIQFCFSYFSTYIKYACRLCLGAWSDHGERTGGFYACNRYETAKQEGVVY